MLAPRLVLLSLVTLSFAMPVARAPAQAAVPIDSTSVQTIRHLLELMGAAQVAVNSMEAVIPVQQAAHPEVPAIFWNEFLERARRETPHLVDSLVSIYAAHFSPTDLAQLVQFYESPLGRHLAALGPQLTQETVQAGQRWGAALGRALAESLLEADAHSTGGN